jgi:NAD(P)H-nitrite reductase large subunit
MENKKENLVENDCGRKDFGAFSIDKHVKPLNGRLVCSCNHVGEGTLLEAIDSKIFNFEKLCLTTNAGTACGDCRPEIKAIMVERLKFNLANKPKPPSPVIGNLVCKCRKVGEGNLLIEIEKNKNISLEALCLITQAAGGCGKCKPAVEAFWEKQKTV